MDDYKQRLIRKLKFKCKALGIELKTTKSIYNNAVLGFCEAVKVFCSSRKLENPLTQSPKGKSRPPEGAIEAYIAETLTASQKAELPSQFRKVFRSIVVETHPDKSSDIGGVDLYQEAVEAKKNNKVGELIALTQDLKIDLSHLTYAAITEVESQIDKMEDDVIAIHNSYPWVWYYSNNLRKGKIIEKFVLPRV